VNGTDGNWIKDEDQFNTTVNSKWLRWSTNAIDLFCDLVPLDGSRRRDSDLCIVATEIRTDPPALVDQYSPSTTKRDIAARANAEMDDAK
jgi:hypothetical protein